MSFYGGLTSTASRLMLKYGQSVTLTYQTGGDIDPATGEVATPPTINTVVGNGASTQFKNSEIDGERVKSGDQRLILERVDTVPEAGWLAQLSNTKYRVMDVMPISPANEDVIYICQLRKQ